LITVSESIERPAPSAALAILSLGRSTGYAAFVSARPKRTKGVEIAMDLYALAEGMLRQRIRREHPKMSVAAVEIQVNRWRTARSGAEHGDAPGRTVPWPRVHRR
jgi:hypothetical protein